MESLRCLVCWWLHDIDIDDIWWYKSFNKVYPQPHRIETACNRLQSSFRRWFRAGHLGGRTELDAESAETTLFGLAAPFWHLHETICASCLPISTWAALHVPWCCWKPESCMDAVETSWWFCFKSWSLIKRKIRHHRCQKGEDELTRSFKNLKVEWKPQLQQPCKKINDVFVEFQFISEWFS